MDTIASYAKYGNILCLEEVHHPQISSVYVERRPACWEAFAYLKAQGYQKLALMFIRSDACSSTYRMVMEAYEDIYGQGNPPVIVDGIANESDTYEQAAAFWEHPDIDCIFANADDMVAGLARGYEEAGKELPFIMGQEAFKQALVTEKKTIVLRSEFIKREKQ